ncbi:coiled-coil domain-containing protein 42 homolog [Folsomia candida]|uniref:coiled-coil domain-containing protein 42 homolog n=1 Tax=Folsomia candida TaxID=158441 RepID=UPI001604CBDE|nr:coiled-coil domain-containing protein 42 homolog [Folsomia candida]
MLRQDIFDCQPVVKPQSKNLGPPRLLKKPLLEYFNERVENHVDNDPTLADHNDQQLLYGISSEKLIANQEIACLDTKLVKARAAWGEEKRLMDERWQAATMKQDEIFKRIPQFNNYYKDLFVRRDRARTQFQKETERIAAVERELRAKNKEIDKLEEIREMSDNRLLRFTIFKTYLQRAKEMSQGEYGDIKDLIDRYAILANGRDTLIKDSENFRESVMKRQRSLDNDVLLKSNEILAYRNFLTEMLEYDTILREKVFWLEDGLSRIKVTAAQRTLVIGQIKMAIHNVYKQIVTVLHRHVNLKPEDTLGQLADIRISITEISRLSHDIRRMLKAAHMTARQEAEARNKLLKAQEERQRKVDKLLNKTHKNVFELFNISTRKSQQMNISKLFFPPKPVLR